MSSVQREEIRVLHCLVCGTLEELPMFDGSPDDDHLLQILCERHVFPSGEPHKGYLFRAPKQDWDNESIRNKVIEQIKGGGSKGIAEFDAKFYETKDTFKEDAMTCYNKHLRPTDGCPDYKTPSKMLVPDTKAERKEAGLVAPSKAPGPKNYLCQFCPVESIVAQKMRDLRSTK
jgi:hypothetical protein